MPFGGALHNSRVTAAISATIGILGRWLLLRKLYEPGDIRSPVMVLVVDGRPAVGRAHQPWGSPSRLVFQRG